MDLYTLVMDSIIGFLLGLILMLVYYLLRHKNRKIVVYNESLLASTEHQLDPSKIVLLYEDWISDPSEFSSFEIKLLSSFGFIKKVMRHGVLSDYQRIREFLLAVNNILDTELPPLIDLQEKYLERLANRGIKSITFIKISSEEGPVFSFTTTPTRFTRKLYHDNELLNNIFLMAGRVEEAQIEGSRILINEITGGERQIAGYLIIELTQNADKREIFDYIVRRVNVFPADREEAKRLLERLL